METAIENLMVGGSHVKHYSVQMKGKELKKSSKMVHAPGPAASIPCEGPLKCLESIHKITKRSLTFSPPGVPHCQPSRDTLTVSAKGIRLLSGRQGTLTISPQEVRFTEQNKQIHNSNKTKTRNHPLHLAVFAGCLKLHP